MKRITLFLLSNKILNLEKMSFLPRIKGLFSLLDKAQVISTGVFVILTVILARYAIMPLPSMPQKCILGITERFMSRSLATDFGMMLQSAPVSTIKSNFWYPYFVKTGTEITGSGIIPNSVYFWFKGNSERIDADCALGRDQANSQSRSLNMFLGKLFYKLRIGFGVCDNLPVFPGNVFAGIIFLKFCVRNSLHFSPQKSVYIRELIKSRETAIRQKEKKP